MHLENAAETLPLPGGGVVDERSGTPGSGIDPKEGQRPHERIGHDLECQGRERSVVGGFAHGFVATVGNGPLDRRHVQRRGEIVDDRVQQGLHPLVAKGRAAQHRDDVQLQPGAANGPDQPLLGDLLALEIGGHDLVVAIGQRLQQKIAIGVRLGAQFLGYGCFPVAGAEILVVPEQGLHPHQVHHPLEVVFRSHRKLDDQRPGSEPVLDHLHHPEIVGADTVHLVDVRDPRDAVLVRLPPHGFGLGLDPAHRAEHRDGPVQHPQRTLHLDGEVHVAGGVDDVDPVVAPMTSGGRGRDGDPALLLLDHPVHGRGAVVHFPQLVVDAGVEQHAFRRGGLAGIDVGHDPDVAGPVEWYLSAHGRWRLLDDGKKRRRFNRLLHWTMSVLVATSGNGRRRGSPPPFCACLPSS